MDDRCTIYRTANFIGKRWTLLILLELYKGRSRWKRYSALKGSLPEITPKMLAARLRELEKEKLVLRRIDTSEFPIKAEYSLTKSGEAFISIIKDIKRWALEHKIKSQVCSSSDCRECRL